MKKRLLSLFLAAVLLFSLAAPAYAAGTEDGAGETGQDGQIGEVGGLGDYFVLSDPLVAAQELYELGLFQGVGVNPDGTPDFDLDGIPTRAQAITMLVRLLGKEEEALSGSWTTPFTDLAEWQVPYVGYAYENGLTLGNGDSTFGGDQPVSAAQYITFVLRALGYDDQAGDFSWDSPWTLSDEIGLTDGSYNEQTTTFLRGDVAVISAYAMNCLMKDSEDTLLIYLYRSGALDNSLDDFSAALMGVMIQIRDAVNLENKAIEFCGQALEATDPTEGLALTQQAQASYADVDAILSAASETCDSWEELAEVKPLLEQVIQLHTSLDSLTPLTVDNYVEYSTAAVFLALTSMIYYMQMSIMLSAMDS